MKLKKLFWILLLSSVSSGFALAQGLTEVYQKELSLLLSQKRALQKSLKKIDRQFRGKINKAEKKIKGLQNKFVALSVDNDKLIHQLSALQLELENFQSNKELVDTTISQAQVSLGIDSSQLTEFKSKEQKLEFIFKKAHTSLSASRKKSLRQESFFLPDGKKREGSVLHFGDIARFALLEGRSEMLMPIGNSNFKIFKDKRSLSTSLNMRDDPPLISAFLFESAEKGISPREKQSFFATLKAGGMIAYIIVILGLLAASLILVRGFLLFRASRVDRQVLSSLQNKTLKGLSDHLEKLKTPFGRVMGKTYQALGKNLQERENIIQESILGELNILDKFGAGILVMAAVAPLLGLLGTVTGMISTFEIITEFGTGDPKLLSSGISEALITTKLGLMVAIPALLLGHLLGGWGQKN